jgi:hypothetical protein
MRDTYLDAMSKVMINAVNSEEYAQATGAMLNGSLTLSAPLRSAVDKAMVQTLDQLSLPSREQVVALAERFTNLEMRLDDIDAKLDRIVELSSANRPPVAGFAPGVKQAAKPDARSTPQPSAKKS